MAAAIEDIEWAFVSGEAAKVKVVVVEHEDLREMRDRAVAILSGNFSLALAPLDLVIQHRAAPGEGEGEGEGKGEGKGNPQEVVKAVVSRYVSGEGEDTLAGRMGRELNVVMGGAALLNGFVQLNWTGPSIAPASDISIPSSLLRPLASLPNSLLVDHQVRATSLSLSLSLFLTL